VITVVKDCRGLIFKFTEGNFADKKRGSISTRRSMILLKRESCQPGNSLCLECSELLKDVMEHDFSCEYSSIPESANEYKKYRLIPEYDSEDDGGFGYGGSYLSDFEFREVV